MLHCSVPCSTLQAVSASIAALLVQLYSRCSSQVQDSLCASVRTRVVELVCMVCIISIGQAVCAASTTVTPSAGCNGPALRAAVGGRQLGAASRLEGISEGNW